MAEVTLKSFLEGDSAVKAANKKLQAASAELNKQKAALAAGSARATPALRDQIQRRIDAAQIAYDEAKSNADSVTVRRTAYFEQNKKTIRSKARSASVDEAKQELSELLALKQQGITSSVIDARIADARDKIAGTGKYAPKPKDKDKTLTPGDQTEAGGKRDYLKEINAAAGVVRRMSDPERRDLAELLKAANFYEGEITGIYTDALVEAYQASIASNKARSTAWGEEVAWSEFLQDKVNEATALGLTRGKGGLAKPSGTQVISTPSEAAAKVEAIFKSELNRLPTAAERDKYVAELIAREKKESAITKTTPKKIGGVTVNVLTGGFDRDQFLKDKLRGLPEYSESKTAARTLNTQSLAKTALANGLNLEQNFGADTVANWIRRVENGEDIDIFKNLIRKTAAVGLPDQLAQLVDSGVDLDAIYAPYKRTMAAILEIPEMSINLDDPTLRSAIGPDKPMTIFDFQKQLRKDARWQYTDQAREEVSSIALKILQDFGFQG
jgi:hypothetical protein